MLQKVFTSEVKELDGAKGYVEAYANAYNNEDFDKDISHPNSFVKTVSENFKKIRVYKNHNQTILVGVPKMLDANDPYGLKTGTQFNMDTPDGKNMFYDVKLITENNQHADLSIGYEVIRRDQKDRRIITEYKLKEYSFLTSWGANPLAITTDIKIEEKEQQIIELLIKMYNLPYNDDRLIKVESILKSLTIAPSVDTQIVEPSYYSAFAGTFDKPKSIYDILT